ncbi:hypothetical protein BDR22DRAFT_499584 [Usnea florida]
MRSMTQSTRLISLRRRNACGEQTLNSTPPFQHICLPKTALFLQSTSCIGHCSCPQNPIFHPSTRRDVAFSSHQFTSSKPSVKAVISKSDPPCQTVTCISLGSACRQSRCWRSGYERAQTGTFFEEEEKEIEFFSVESHARTGSKGEEINVLYRALL